MRILVAQLSQETNTFNQDWTESFPKTTQPLIFS